MSILRGLFYLFAVSGVAQLISLEGYRGLSVVEYSEHSLTEHMQDIMSFLSCMLFLYVARSDKKLKIVSTLLAALMAMMFIRESDSLLDTYVFDGAWQAVVCVVLVSVMVFLWGQFNAIFASIKVYSQQPSFGIFLAGLITLVAFSRLMGRASFWQAVMGDSYMRIVKNIVEESIETLGYTLILISAVELVIVCRRRNQIEK